MAPAVSPPTYEHDTAQRLRVVFGRLSRRLRLTDTAASAGTTPARVSTLLNIERHSPMRLSELAASEGINPTMLSRIVADLVDGGLCKRSCDPSDRRSAWVEATPAGRELAERMRAQRTEAVQSALGCLSDGERRTIEQALPALEALAEQFEERRP
ncbi:MAG: MarR family winged helix-turn-helix transcriptional regulator [Solirubrobacteraceae bacterium]|jgi:DNA-binding MarR family transcriptional regulator